MKEWDPRYFIYNSSYWSPILNKTDDEMKPLDEKYKIIDRLIHQYDRFYPFGMVSHIVRIGSGMM